MTLSDAVCLTERAVVCPINRAQFLEIVRLRPGVAVLLSSILAIRLQELQTRLDALGQPVQVRLAQVMLDLAYRLGHEIEPDVYELHVELRHEGIASLAQASRVMPPRPSRPAAAGIRRRYPRPVPCRHAALEGQIEQLQLEALE